jgi:hypothetical protein
MEVRSAEAPNPRRLPHLTSLDAVHQRLRQVDAAIEAWEDYQCAPVAPDLYEYVRRPRGPSLEALRHRRAVLLTTIAELRRGRLADLTHRCN